MEKVIVRMAVITLEFILKQTFYLHWSLDHSRYFYCSGLLTGLPASIMVLLRPTLNTVARVMLLEHVISSHYPTYNLPLASHFPWTKSLFIMVYKDHHLAFVLLPSIWNVLCSDSPYSCAPPLVFASDVFPIAI